MNCVSGENRENLCTSVGVTDRFGFIARPVLFTETVFTAIHWSHTTIGMK
jgi:hypothetical protein